MCPCVGPRGWGPGECPTGGTNGAAPCSSQLIRPSFPKFQPLLGPLLLSPPLQGQRSPETQAIRAVHLLQDRKAWKKNVRLYCDAFRERLLSSEPWRRSLRSIGRHTLPWLWTHKVDSENWHLMAYNWNEFSEILKLGLGGDWRGAGQPLLGSAHGPSRMGVSPNERRGPVTLHSFRRDLPCSGRDGGGDLWLAVSPHWPLKDQGLRILEKLIGSLWVLYTCW